MTEPEAQPPRDPDPAPSDTAANEGIRLLEARARELQQHIQTFSRELQKLAGNLEARKQETAVLKIMFYTGVVVLMLAFFYSSNALHQAQLKSFEANLDHLQALTDSNLTALQRGLMQDIRGLKKQVKDLKQGSVSLSIRERRLEAALVTMNQAIAPLGNQSLDWALRVDALHRESEGLFSRFQQYASDNAPPPEENPDSLF